MDTDESGKLLNIIIKIWREAYTAYNEPGKRQDERARTALKILGFTSGRRTPNVDKSALFYEYAALITGSPDFNDFDTWKNPPAPLERQAAIERIAHQHNMTPAAVKQHIKLFKAQQAHKCTAAGMPSHGWHKRRPPHK